MPVGGSVKRTPCPVNAFTIRAVNGADRAAVTSRMYSNNVKNMSKILIYIRFQCGLATTLEVIISSVAVNGTIDTVKVQDQITRSERGTGGYHR